MTYNPKEYWSRREVPSVGGIPEYAEKYIKKHLQGETILDFGPGVGGLFHLYKGFKVTGLDIVDRYKQQAISRAKELGLDYTHVVGDLRRFKGDYDCVVASKVLLHVPPDDIKDVLYKLMTIGKVIVWVAQFENAEPHNFSHDFSEIVDIRDVVRNGNQLLFIC